MPDQCLRTAFVCPRRREATYVPCQSSRNKLGSLVPNRFAARTNPVAMACSRQIPGGQTVNSCCNLRLFAGIGPLRQPIVENIFSGLANVVANIYHEFNCNL
jgi:hypothetical protein